MPGFDALYKQTVTLFNRVKADDEAEYFIPTVLAGVHLIIDHSANWNAYGGNQADNTRLNVRYRPSGNNAMIGQLTYCEPKEWKCLESFDGKITFRYGNDTDFDFFVKGVYTPDQNKMVSSILVNNKTVTLSTGFINDDAYGPFGFYNMLNKEYDHVFAITQVSQLHLIPHFELLAR